MIACSVTPGLLFAGELTGIRIATGPDSTRVVLDLNSAADHRLFELNNPDRIVLDLEQTEASDALRLPLPKGRVRSVRTGVQPGGRLRVVLDLSEAADSRSFALVPDGESGHRVVIDLSEQSESGSAVRVQADEYTARDTVIVIDAGHGGKDPGASGNGVREKDVTLEIARRLASLVDSQPGFRSVLVRDDDRFVTFPDRLSIAHNSRADLFISIHADYVDDPSVRGATIYTIKDSRATSETARRVADRENSADLIGGVTISDKEDTLARVLLDVVQSYSIRKSITAGERFIDQLSRVTTVRKGTVEQGNFVVLTSPDIPSVLIETAYLSNPSEASNLRRPEFQDVMARAMLAGIVDYFRLHPPTGSYIARNPPPEPRGPIRHVISRGETLSGIAERYRISLTELRRSNRISGDVIRIGQVLTIPVTG